MTLNEFTKPFLTDMGNITMFLTDFLDSDRKDKEIDYMLEYLNDGYENKTNKFKIKSIIDDVNLYESYMSTYRVNCNILGVIFNNIHYVLSEKYKISKEIFDDKNIDTLNEYIDKIFDSEFIKSIYENVTPCNEKRNNILFILLTIIFDTGYQLEFVNKDKNLIFNKIIEYPKDHINLAIRIVELKIFQYGFIELKNILTVEDDKELIESINTLGSND